MFYSHEILNSKQHGVAIIWQVANSTQSVGLKRVTRKSIDQVDIPKACDLIMNPGPPMSLRLESQLLCGVARVFSRQCVYTLNDAEKVQQTMRTIVIIWGQTGVDPKAGKTRRENITLPNDPTFTLPDKIPQFSLEDGELLFPSQEKFQSGKGDKSQSQLSPFGSPIGIDFTGGHTAIQFDFLQSPDGDFQLPSPFMRKSAAGTFLPKGQESIDMDMDMNPGIFDDDDDYGPFLDIGEDGGLIDNDLELPILPGMEVPENLPNQEHEHDLPIQDQDQILPDADVDMPLVGNDPLVPPAPRQVFEHPASPDQGRHHEAVAPAVKRRRIALKQDSETLLSRNVLKGWQENYVQDAEEARLKKLRKKPTATQSKEFAYQLVLGNGLFNVGGSRDITHVTYPLAQSFAGDGLRNRVWGPPEDNARISQASTPKRGRRTAAEAFGDDEEGQRNVRSRLEETPGQGRSQEDMPDFNIMFSDQSIPEMGMEGPQPMPEHMSSSLMPWNQTPSVGRGSVGPNPQQAGRQLSVRGSSLPTFEPFQDAHSSDVGFPGSGPAGPAVLLDGIDQQNKDEAHWSRSMMDTAGQDFLKWTEEHAKRTGYAKMGDSNENRRWVKFEDFCEPGQRDHVVAAQAFYHILSLATKNAISVEQDVENMQPFGTIRVGVDMTAHLEDMD